MFENTTKLYNLNASQFLLCLFEHYHEGVMITDHKGVLIYYNKALAALDGLDHQDVLGRPVTEIYRLNSYQSTTMRAIRLARPIINRRHTYHTIDGKLVNSLSSAYPLFEQNSIVGAVCTVTDYSTLVSNAPGVEAAPAPQTLRVKAGERKNNGTPFSFEDIIGQDEKLLGAIDVARKAASTPSAIMLVGETGTGKELFAKAIHHAGPRHKQPFMAINCAAIPSTLLEGILFGTVKGAFTGAVDKAGLFELADGGTLFLDELNSMPIDLQPKLLRVLQEQHVRRIGSNTETPISVKVISAVNGSPFSAIERGDLRSDLFYRLGVVVVQLPPLRERRNDISLLLNYFREKLNHRLEKNVLSFDKEATELLETYQWPGNVRELEHAVEATLNLMNDDEEVINLNHIKLSLPQFNSRPFPTASDFFQAQNLSHILNSNQAPMGSASPPGDIYSAEVCCLEDALRRNRGNVARCARELGYSPQRLHYRLKKFNLNSSDYK